MKYWPQILAMALFLFLLGGCASQISPEAAAQIQAMKNQQAISDQKNADELDALKSTLATKATLGQLAPATHPFDAMNQTIAELRPVLFWTTIILGGAAIASWIASFFFSAVTFLTKLSLSLTKIDLLCLAATLALPFIKWAVLIILGGFGVIWLVEAIRDHFDIRQATIDTLAAIGIKLGAPATAAVAEAKVMAANPPRVPTAKATVAAPMNSATAIAAAALASLRSQVAPLKKP